MLALVVVSRTEAVTLSCVRCRSSRAATSQYAVQHASQVTAQVEIGQYACTRCLCSLGTMPVTQTIVHSPRPARWLE